MEFFGATITKKPHFLPKNGQKMPFCGLKQCFWGVSGQLYGPPPYFESPGLGKLCFARSEARYRVFWSHHHKKTAFFCPKTAKKSHFLA